MLPMMIFFRHNDYELLSSVFALSSVPLLVAGFICALFMGLGRWARIPVVIFLLVLLIDIQTGWLTTIGLRLLLVVVGCGAVTWIFRKRLSQVLLVLFMAMIAGTVLQGPGQMIASWGDQPLAGDPEQPFLMHIILDEYAAPEALDRTFDLDGELADEVTRFFTDYGFRLYTRAYSRFVNTAESIPVALNPGLPSRPSQYWPDGWRKGELLVQNAWFSRLGELGYGVHVYQSDFIRYLPYA